MRHLLYINAHKTLIAEKHKSSSHTSWQINYNPLLSLSSVSCSDIKEPSEFCLPYSLEVKKMQVVANFDFQPSPFSHATGEMLISPVGHRDESFVNFTDALEGASDDSPPSVAAVKVQKVYRSYRTRRRLADSVVVAEELW